MTIPGMRTLQAGAATQAASQSPTGGRFVPPQINSIEDTKLSSLWLQDLTLKVLYSHGYMTGFKIAETIALRFAGGARRDLVILLGKKNADYFLPINEEHKFFKKIITLEHPRYIMQYKLKQKDSYINKYYEAINN